jgi:hypothetical protein
MLLSWPPHRGERTSDAQAGSDERVPARAVPPQLSSRVLHTQHRAAGSNPKAAGRAGEFSADRDTKATLRSLDAKKATILRQVMGNFHMVLLAAIGHMGSILAIFSNSAPDRCASVAGPADA